MKKVFPFFFYVLYFAALSAMMPFLVLHYQRLGFSGTQIGFITGVSQFISLFAGPLLTGLADSTRRHKLVMGLSLGVLALNGALFPLYTTLPLVVAAVIVMAIFDAPIVPLSDSVILYMLGPEKEKYGRISLGATLGWGLAAPVAGMLVQQYDLDMTFWMYTLLVFLSLLACQKYVFPAHIEAAPLEKGIRTLIANPRWVTFSLMAFICGAGFAAMNTYFFAYMKDLGANESQMGFSLTIVTLTELPVLFFANRFLKHLGSQGLLGFTMGMTVIRLLLYALLWSPVAVMISQVMNGLTMPLFWAAGVAYADENAPAGMKASAQSLLGALVSGIGAAVGGFLGGALLDLTSSRGMFLIFGLVLAFSLIAITVSNRRIQTSGYPMSVKQPVE